MNDGIHNLSRGQELYHSALLFSATADNNPNDFLRNAGNLLDKPVT